MEQNRETMTGLMASQKETGQDYRMELYGKVIGNAAMWRSNEGGYSRYPDQWQRECAFEAMSAILPAIFAARVALGGVAADIDPRNSASLF